MYNVVYKRRLSCNLFNVLLWHCTLKFCLKIPKLKQLYHLIYYNTDIKSWRSCKKKKLVEEDLQLVISVLSKTNMRLYTSPKSSGHAGHVTCEQWWRQMNSLFGWLVADGWCWFVLREEYCWLVAGGWLVLREKYCWLVADNRANKLENMASPKSFGHAGHVTCEQWQSQDENIGMAD
jgi:hypothetical protein